jgi:hypothetical protein
MVYRTPANDKSYGGKTATFQALRWGSWRRRNMTEMNTPNRAMFWAEAVRNSKSGIKNTRFCHLFLVWCQVTNNLFNLNFWKRKKKVPTFRLLKGLNEVKCVKVVYSSWHMVSMSINLSLHFGRMKNLGFQMPFNDKWLLNASLVILIVWRLYWKGLGEDVSRIFLSYISSVAGRARRGRMCQQRHYSTKRITWGSNVQVPWHRYGVNKRWKWHLIEKFWEFTVIMYV